MTFQQLTAKDNPLLKTIRKLVRHPEKSDTDLMAVEGVRMLEEVENAGCNIDAVVISENFGAEPRERRLLDRWLARDIRICRVNEEVFASVSDVRAPQGAMALVRMPQYLLHQLRPGNNPLILCALGIQDPGNLGTLIRTAAAAGADAVFTTRGTVAARNSKTLRATAGAFFHLPVVERLTAEELISYCVDHDISMFRTDTHEGIAHTRANLTAPCAIVLGNEGNGMDNEEAFTRLPAIRIPMAGNTESLNVAAAGAIILFEAFRQRETRGARSSV